MTHDVPCISKVVKGQFMNIGASKFSPLKKLHQDVLVHSIKTGLKVLGHSVSRMDSRDGRTHRLVALEQRLSIPVTYKGWFELVSENGRSAKPIDNVRELAKQFPTVSNVLVRQNIAAYLVNERDGKMTFDKTKIVISGEQLKIIGEYAIDTTVATQGKVRLLKCVDSRGEDLYLSLDQKALFTPIASENDVTGVFLIKDIMHRFRLPLTVKLIQGVWPKVDANRFTGLIRLDWAYTDENAFVCPLDRNQPRIYPIPTEVNLRLVTAVNNDELKANEAFSNIMVKCNRLITNYHNTIHLIISVPEGVMKAKSHTMANLYTDTNPKVAERPSSQMKRSKSREDILHDELDDLYGYLRAGQQPPVERFTRTRDSDEETYYEEPEFEPMTKFKSRLAKLDRGDVVGSQKNANYSFVDPRTALDANHNRVPVNGRTFGDAPPELPPRNFSRSDSAPQITSLVITSNGQSSPAGSSGSPVTRVISIGQAKPTLHRRISRDSMSNSKGSRSSDEKKDSSDYKENKSSKTGSGKRPNRKTSMPLLYL